MTKITLVRHGLVENPVGIYYGRLPGYSLAIVGREQATAAGSYLTQASVEAVYHSPMLRAYETATIVRANCAMTAPLEECALLNEIYSPFDGRPMLEMEERDWDFYRGVGPPYEQPGDVAARMVRFFDLAREKHPGGHIVGVSHADPISFAILWAAGLPLSPEQRKRLMDCGIADSYPAPASISTFLFADEPERKLLDFKYFNPAGS